MATTMTKRTYETPACAGKVGYESAAEAREVMRSAPSLAALKSDLFTYRCQECGAWHVGRGEKFRRPVRRTSKNWNWRKAATED